MKKMLLIASAALMLLPLTLPPRPHWRFLSVPGSAYGWYGTATARFTPICVRSLTTACPTPPGETGHAREGRPGIRRRRLCRDLRETQDHVDAPGTYTIEMRAPGQPQFAEKIYVLAGKTVHVEPGFHPETR